MSPLWIYLNNNFCVPHKTFQGKLSLTVLESIWGHAKKALNPLVTQAPICYALNWIFQHPVLKWKQKVIFHIT